MDYIKEIEEKLAGIVNAFSEEVSSIRGNRPNTKMVENIKVNYLDSTLTIQQMASISIEPPRDIVISPWDKEAIPAIEKAIGDSAFGLSVSTQGGLIRAKLPEMTEEKINEFIKLVKSTAEGYKIKIRTIRDDINKKALKDIKDEDEKFRTKEEIQKKVDAANEAIEEIVEAKTKEIKG